MVKNEGELYVGVLVNVTCGAGGRGSFQMGAAERMRFVYRGLSPCRVEVCNKREDVIQDCWKILIRNSFFWTAASSLILYVLLLEYAT